MHLFNVHFQVDFCTSGLRLKFNGSVVAGIVYCLLKQPDNEQLHCAKIQSQHLFSMEGIQHLFFLKVNHRHWFAVVICLMEKKIHGSDMYLCLDGIPKAGEQQQICPVEEIMMVVVVKY